MAMDATGDAGRPATAYPDVAPTHQLVPASYVALTRPGHSGREVLLLRRSNTGFMDGYWALVAGHVEPGESAVSAAVREAREEVGIAVVEADLTPLCTVHRTDGSVPVISICVILPTFQSQRTPAGWSTPVGISARSHPSRCCQGLADGGGAVPRWCAW